jgi:hypothetical protein
VRDIQINVYDTDNKPPEIGPLYDRCVEAGTVIDCLVSATDPDIDFLHLLSTSGIYELNTGGQHLQKLIRLLVSFHQDSVGKPAWKPSETSHTIL